MARVHPAIPTNVQSASSDRPAGACSAIHARISSRNSRSSGPSSSSTRSALLVVWLGADLELAEGHAGVHPGLLGKAEHALADDVSLDLVGAAGDRNSGA